MTDGWWAIVNVIVGVIGISGICFTAWWTGRKLPR
jgi:hypothetical protein